MSPPDDPKDPAPQGDQPKRQPGRRRRRRRRKPSAAQQPARTAQPQPKAAGAAARRGSGTGKSKRETATAKDTPNRRKQRKKKPPSRRPRIPTTREVSAGGVVYRRADEEIEVVLASRRTRRGQLAWGLAKGGIEEGESKEEAAIREVREETGLIATIEADLGDTKYIYVWDDIRIRKTVHFFLMRFTGGDVDDRDDEMEEIRWFPLERAIKRAAYRGERDMLVKASELLR
jgi:8-oxo-dGTP pyrophosphatase MutT (NUDIX family)